MAVHIQDQTVPGQTSKAELQRALCMKLPPAAQAEELTLALLTPLTPALLTLALLTLLKEVLLRLPLLTPLKVALLTLALLKVALLTQPKLLQLELLMLLMPLILLTDCILLLTHLNVGNTGYTGSSNKESPHVIPNLVNLHC